jgi:hypothetical protein
MTFQASPIVGALPSNTRRAFTTGITMYKKFHSYAKIHRSVWWLTHAPPLYVLLPIFFSNPPKNEANHHQLSSSLEHCEAGGGDLS